MPDLIIAGAGPAGLATALYAAKAGLHAVVIDPRVAPTDTPIHEHVHEPIDKACGEGLMPGGVRALQALVVELPGAPIRGIRYLDGIDTPRRCSAVTRDEVCAAPNCTRHCVRGRLLRACAPCAARSRRSGRAATPSTPRVSAPATSSRPTDCTPRSDAPCALTLPPRADTPAGGFGSTTP